VVGGGLIQEYCIGKKWAGENPALRKINYKRLFKPFVVYYDLMNADFFPLLVKQIKNSACNT